MGEESVSLDRQQARAHVVWLLAAFDYAAKEVDREIGCMGNARPETISLARAAMEAVLAAFDVAFDRGEGNDEAERLAAALLAYLRDHADVPEPGQEECLGCAAAWRAVDAYRCTATCPHGDRCRLVRGHEDGHNHACPCTEPDADGVVERGEETDRA